MKKLWLFILLLLILTACNTLPPAVDWSLIFTPTPVPTPSPTPEPTIPPVNPYSAAGFRAFVAQAEASRNADRQRLVNDYLALLPQSPLVDGPTAAFLWRGPANSVALIGDMNSWDTSTAIPLTRFENTDTWYLIFELHPAARLDYQFLVDGSTLVLDDLNPRQVRRTSTLYSELQMPEYQRPPELALGRPTVPAAQKGTLTTHTLESQALLQTRTFFVYQPAVPPAAGSYPSVYIQDGSDYINLIQATDLLDGLIAEQTIEPLVAVFVPPLDRQTEYSRNPAYTQFLADELLPFIQNEYQTNANPGRTAVLGSSLGGFAAVHTAFTRPELFGLAAGHSGDYSLDNEAMTRQLRLQAPLPIQLYLAVGIFENQVSGRDILGANQRLAQVLTEKGFTLTFIEAPQGHSWGFWADQFGATLRAFFPYSRE